MRLLDADTISYLHRGDARVVDRLRLCEDPDIGVAIVTRAEVLRARFEYLLKSADGDELLRAQSYLLRTELLLRGLQLVPCNKRTASEFDRLRKLRGVQKIGHVDLMLASVALARDATLVTRNLRHFRQIPGVKLENWVD
jgi:tRNA(fMet)-specific endonuclease VapC